MARVFELARAQGVPLSEKYRIEFTEGGSNRLDAREDMVQAQIGDPFSGEFSIQNLNLEDISLIPLSGKIQEILLAFLVSAGDPRWMSLKLPSNLLILGLGLRDAGFGVKIRPFDEAMERNTLSGFDLLGFTLFEDHFPLVQAGLDRLRRRFNGWIAAGGPMATQSPLGVLYHLPQINLLIRGEAERAFPRLLKTLNSGDATKVFLEKGFAIDHEGLLVLSGLEEINRPDLSDTPEVKESGLSFIDAGQLERGLEMNCSRGCTRGCLFCSRPHGRKVRRSPLDQIDSLAAAFDHRLQENGVDHEEARSININDDDILQDPEYARGVLEMLHGRGLPVWGIQTSISSFFPAKGRVRENVLALVSDPRWYHGHSPLLWIGTDVFIPARAMRLGKHLPDRRSLEKLFALMEKCGIRHYHYWISSDADSMWDELIDELGMIESWSRKFSHFHVLAHAPFLVPYAGTPIFSRMIDGGRESQIRFKKRLTAPHPAFSIDLVDRVETVFPAMNEMLKNRTASPGSGGAGFFDLFKTGDFKNLWLTVYTFLRSERLQMEGKESKPGELNRLHELERRMEERLALLI